MAIRSKRYTSADVRSGKIQLPAKLKFLAQAKYLAVVNRHANQAETWAIEFQPATAKKLICATILTQKANDHVKSLSYQNNELRKQIEELQKELESLTDTSVALKNANARLMKNIAEDTTPEKYNRSPKSALSAALERGTDLSKKPYSGGKAGL